VITQAIMIAASPAELAIFAGRLNEPPPIIDPTTTPLSNTNPNFLLAGCWLSSVDFRTGAALLTATDWSIIYS
jgi:hypothetical protein